jgi:hypothetical protein
MNQMLDVAEFAAALQDATVAVERRATRRH